MPSSQGLSFTHERAGTPQVERCLSRTGSKRTRTNCCCSRQRNSTSSRTKSRDILSRLALTLGGTTANSVLSLSLAALLVLQQRTPALADSSTSTPPPSTATSSSTATQAASRTVIDVVSGENTVLSEQNTPDNRQGPDHQQQDIKNNIPVGDTSEVSCGAGTAQKIRHKDDSLMMPGACTVHYVSSPYDAYVPKLFHHIVWYFGQSAG